MQKKEKRKWLFRKPTTHQTPLTKVENDDVFAPPTARRADERHDAIAAAATNATAAAQAVAATAQAAVEVVRLAKPPVSRFDTSFYSGDMEHQASTIIQTAFRGYLVSHELKCLPCRCIKRCQQYCIGTVLGDFYKALVSRIT